MSENNTVVGSFGTVLEPARFTECIGNYDVAVCGGGIAGIAAALAAARNGARTVLLERGFLLGGLATAGLIAIYLPLCDGMGNQVTFGIAEELLRFSVRHGSDATDLASHPWLGNGTREARVKERFLVRYNPQVFAVDVETLLRDAGVTILFGAQVCSAVTDGDRITHLIVEGKSGRQAIVVRSVVDCTGDADIVHLSGEDEALFGQGNVLAGWYYEVKDGRYALHPLGAADIPDEERDAKRPTYLTDRRFSGLDTAELSEQVTMSHAASLSDFLRDGPVTAEHTLATLPTVPQVRMTRRVAGISTLDTKDIRVRFDDSVGLFGDWRKRGPVYELRFSALHGKRVANLICAGRNISATDAMWNVTRVIPVCALSGEAAGTAAAFATDFRTVDMGKLTDRLIRQGVKLHANDL